MLIDQFTVFAQILNFVILIFLLNRFLFRPIQKAMGERQDLITSRWQEAEHQIQQAQQEAESLHQYQQQLEQERAQILDLVRQEAEQWRQSELHRIKAEIKDQRIQWLADLEQERQTLWLSFRQKVAQQVCQISRHVLREMANVDLETHLVEMMILRLQQMSEQEWICLVDGLVDSKLVRIQSCFSLHPDMAQRLEEVLEQHLGVIHPDYQVMPEQGCGIEIELDGCKLTWGLDHYLQKLEEKFIQNLLPLTPSHSLD